MHNSCFKQAVRFQWNRELERAICPLPKCGAQIVEYGKPAYAYKGNGQNRRRGVLKTLMKTAGKGHGFGGFFRPRHQMFMFRPHNDECIIS